MGLLPRSTSLRGMIAGGWSRVGEEGAECDSCESSLPRGRAEGGLREGEGLVTGGWLGSLQKDRRCRSHMHHVHIHTCTCSTITATDILLSVYPLVHIHFVFTCLYCSGVVY